MNPKLALTVLSLASPSLAQVPDFGAIVPITEGVQSANRARSFDVDRDGDLDLVLTNTRGNQVLWLEAETPGQFAAPRVLVQLEGTATAPAASLDAALLDLQGNGGDLFVSQSLQRRVLHFPRIDATTFGAPTTFAQPDGRANSLLALDFDGDGDDDLLAAADFGSPGTWIFENVNGVLGAPVRLGPGGRSIEPIDFELDGDVDLLVATTTGALHALRNDGAVGALTAETVGFSTSTFDFVTTDFNGDGFVDVAISGYTSNAVRVFRGDGTGAFSLIATISYSLHHPSDPRIELLDFDGDGDRDIAIAPLNDRRVDWIENRGSGGFAAVSIDALNAASATRFFHSADLDEDGALDLVSLDLAGAVQVGLTAPSGIPGDLAEVTRRWEQVVDAFPIDADSDGDLDVAVISEQDGIGIAFNDGTGEFTFPVNPVSANEPERGTAVDLDGDGRQDLLYRSALGHSTPGQVLVAYQGTAGFSPPVLVGDSTGGTPRTADVDLDGDLDVVTERTVPHRLVAYLQQPNGTFSGEIPVVDLFHRPLDYRLRHMDGDGILDIVTHETAPPGMGSARFHVYFGLAGGGYEPRVALPLPQFPFLLGSPQFEDLDGDGHVDVVYRAGTGPDASVWWTRNLGARQFAPAAVVGVLGEFIVDIALGRPIPGGPAAIAVATAFVGSFHRYRVFEVTPSVTFGAFDQVDSLGNYTAAMFFADLGSGAEDLVLADNYLDQVGVAYNKDWRDFGSSYCQNAVPNSTGVPGRLTAFGSSVVAMNRFELVASELPVGSFTYFLASLDAGFTAGPAGSAGNLCLGGMIGRLNQSGLVGAASASGVFRATVDLAAVPQPTGAVAVLPQSTWYFQGWHRDVGPTSNFTTGFEVTFE